MIAAGIGARARVTPDEIVAAVRKGCERAGIDVRKVSVLAALARAETETAVLGAAGLLELRAHFCTIDALRAEAGGCATRSDRSLAATGVPSVAEAAALAAAGPDAMLIVPRIALPTVTVALAEGPGGPAP